MQELFKSQYELEETAYAINKLMELKYITTDMSRKSWSDISKIEDITYDGQSL